MVVEAGPEALTLASVAGRAKVSKGGFLYHFSSRDALIQELIALSISKLSSSMATMERAEHESATFDPEIVAGVILALASGPAARTSAARAFGWDCTIPSTYVRRHGLTIMRHLAAWICAAPTRR